MFKIYENVLPSNEADKIEKILSSNNFPWYYQDKVGDATDSKRYYWNHMFYINGVVNSEYGSIADYIYSKIKTKKKILRVQANCYPKEIRNYKNKLHVDTPDKHEVFLYYVNTCNGSTNLKIDGKLIKVPTKKNTAVRFSGNLHHQSVAQTDTKLRLNINFNLV